MSKQILLIGAVALGLSGAVFASNNAMSVPASTPGFVPGITLGIQAGYDLSGWKNLSDVGIIALGYPVFGNIEHPNGFAGRIAAGYDFHPNFAAEVGYTYLFNKPSFSIYSGKIETQIIDLVGKIKVPFNDAFGIYAKAGVDYMISSWQDSSNNSSEHSFNVVYGVGLNYNIAPNIVTDISWTKYNGNAKIGNDYQPNVDFFALGVAYKFNLL